MRHISGISSSKALSITQLRVTLQRLDLNSISLRRSSLFSFLSSGFTIQIIHTTSRNHLNKSSLISVYELSLFHLFLSIYD
jgi:hypothetical protein